ncbi:MAG: zinc-ribbon domain-containing protein [Thermoplasmata archaeon]
MNCTNCGAPLGEGAKYCLMCGSPVLVAPAREPAQPPASTWTTCSIRSSSDQ